MTNSLLMKYGELLIQNEMLGHAKNSLTRKVDLKDQRIKCLEIRIQQLQTQVEQLTKNDVAAPTDTQIIDSDNYKQLQTQNDKNITELQKFKNQNELLTSENQTLKNRVDELELLISNLQNTVQEAKQPEDRKIAAKKAEQKRLKLNSICQNLFVLQLGISPQHEKDRLLLKLFDELFQARQKLMDPVAEYHKELKSKLEQLEQLRQSKTADAVAQQLQQLEYQLLASQIGTVQKDFNHNKQQLEQLQQVFMKEFSQTTQLVKENLLLQQQLQEAKQKADRLDSTLKSLQNSTCNADVEHKAQMIIQLELQLKVAKELLRQNLK